MQNRFRALAMSVSILTLLVSHVGWAQGLTPADQAMRGMGASGQGATEMTPAQSALSTPADAASSDLSEGNTPQVAVNPAEDVASVKKAGWMNGYPDGNFHSEQPLTRAELASILVKTFRLKERPVKEASIALKDVPASYWASDDIQTVMTRGVMEGYHGNGYFYPNQRVTRGEALAIVAQAYGVQQLDDATVSSILAQYPDSAEVPAWARKAMVTSLKNGFVETTGHGQIRPMQSMTRGDMAFALGRYLDRLHETERKMVE